MYKAKLLKIWDGDTIDMDVNLGLGFFCNARIRFIGVDAPEIFKVKKTSQEFAKGMIALLEVRKWFGLEPGIFELNVIGRGLYGRWLGEVWKLGNPESINDYMKSKFYGTEYFSWKHQEPLKGYW